MHRANAEFWKEYRALPTDIRERADKQFALLRANPRHPSLSKSFGSVYLRIVLSMPCFSKKAKRRRTRKRP